MHGYPVNKASCRRSATRRKQPRRGSVTIRAGWSCAAGTGRRDAEDASGARGRYSTKGRWWGTRSTFSRRRHTLGRSGQMDTLARRRSCADEWCGRRRWRGMRLSIGSMWQSDGRSGAFGSGVNHDERWTSGGTVGKEAVLRRHRGTGSLECCQICCAGSADIGCRSSMSKASKLYLSARRDAGYRPSSDWVIRASPARQPEEPTAEAGQRLDGFLPTARSMRVDGDGMVTIGWG